MVNSDDAIEKSLLEHIYKELFSKSEKTKIVTFNPTSRQALQHILWFQNPFGKVKEFKQNAILLEWRRIL